MWKVKIKISLVMIAVLLSTWSLVQADTAEIKALNSPADLDLSGNIVYAVNFGNNGNPNVGGIVFTEDQEHSTITLDVEGEGPATWWGSYPGTGDSGLDQLMNGLAYRDEEPPHVSIDVGGLIVGEAYFLQIIGYEPAKTNRNIDLFVEDKEIVTGLNPIIQQGGIVGKGGIVVKYEFIAGDSILNIRMLSHLNACAISGFILTEIPETSIAFADYASGTTIELAVGKGIWQLNWGQGPWTWSELTGLPLLDSNVSGILDMYTTAPANVSADLVATLPVACTLTLSAHDEDYKDVTIGTMVLSGSGINVIDINASRVIMDEGSGMCFAPFHPPGPKLSLTLEEATGAFVYISQTGDWELSLAGSYAAPLVEGLGLQDNILAALGGKVPVIGGIGTFALSGQYTPDMSKMPLSFCEYGRGSSTQLAAGGGGWDQQWGLGPWEWHPCPAETNAQFLNGNVAGYLTTQATGQPTISEDLILHLPLAGQLILTEHAQDDPGKVIGQITCGFTGTFVADMNAERAIVNEAEGTITGAFGTSVEDVPDGLLTVIEKTGTFADIEQVSPWKWYVNGSLKIVRVPDLSVQDNIFAALQQAELIIGAEEEFVLSGLYYRSSP